jgi:hypothetical protein
MRLREIVAPVVSVLAPRRRRSPEEPEPLAAKPEDDDRKSTDASDAQGEAARQGPSEGPEKGGIDRYA